MNKLAINTVLNKNSLNKLYTVINTKTPIKNKLFCDCNYYTCTCLTDKNKKMDFEKYILEKEFINKKFSKNKSNKTYNYLLDQWKFSF